MKHPYLMAAACMCGILLTILLIILWVKIAICLSKSIEEAFFIYISPFVFAFFLILAQIFKEST